MRRSSSMLPIALLMAASAGVFTTPAVADRILDQPISKELQSPANPRITSELHHVLSVLRSGDAAARKALLGKGHSERAHPIAVLKGINADQIEVYIWVSTWNDATKAALEAAGAVITGDDAERNLYQADIALDKVETVAAVKGVRHLRRPSYGIASAGSVQTEGDGLLVSSLLRPLENINGTGIKVGVISNGLFNPLFPHCRAESGGNLDERVFTGNLPVRGEGSGLISRFLGNVEVFPQSFNLHEVPYSNDHYVGQLVAGGPSVRVGGTDWAVSSIGNNTVSLSGGTLSHCSSSFLGEFEVNVGTPVGNGVGVTIHYNPNRQTVVPEGAAILETIHDIAPGAQLYYGSGNTDIQVKNTRNFLASNDVDVIVDNMLFFDSGRFDGTSTLSRGAQKLAEQNNIVYLVSGGNFTPPPNIIDTNTEELSARSGRFPLFINGSFSPDTQFSSSKVHNFASGRIGNGREDYIVVLPQDGVIDVAIVWDDVWDEINPRATDDMDLYLNRIVGAQVGPVVASSVDIQANSGRPFERVTTFPGDGEFALSIRRKNSQDTSRRLFSLMILQGEVKGTDVRFLTHGVPLNNGDALPPVISVGAIDIARSVNSVAPETVPGLDPGPGLDLNKQFIKWYQAQTTPSVVSYSGTANLSATYYEGAVVRRPGIFNGSSAAVAHIGGMVALLRHGFRDIPSYRYYDMLRDTSISEAIPFPNASEVSTEVRTTYGVTAPRYYRPNALDTYLNTKALQSVVVARQAVPVGTWGSTNWEKSIPIDPYAQPVFGESSLGLTLSPGGEFGVFGFWQTPLFEFEQTDGTSSVELRSDRIYELKARVGSDETDPKRVPNFRLRLITGSNDEAVSLDVAGVSDSADNTPTTLAGKEYRLYYRPATDAIAAQGVRFALDLVHFGEHDNNDATLYLVDVVFRELDYKP